MSTKTNYSEGVEYGSIDKEIADNLRNQLKDLPTGKENGLKFQKISREILNFSLIECFSTLSIDEEKWDYFGTQRTDLKFTNDYRNNRDNSFWHQMFHLYKAESVFIECKNSSKNINNYAIRQVISYDDKSAGKLRIIISRKGLDRKGWDRVYAKYNNYFGLLILVLSEQDLLDLIDYRVGAKEGYPEEVFSRIRDTLIKRSFENLN